MKTALLWCLALLFAGSCASSCACSSAINSRPGQIVIDCLTADRSQIDPLEHDLTPLVFGVAPDWSSLYDHVKNAGKVIGGCVLSELVQQYLGGKKAVPTDEGWKARGVLDQFRSEVAGGATFHTKFGDL